MRPPPTLLTPPGVDRLVALVAYDEAGRRLVADLKFANRRGLVGRLGAALAAVAPARPDVVTWAPTSARRRRDRGYDQAELLARVVARRLRCPAARLLVRGAGQGPQTGRTAAQRLRGPRFEVVGAVGPRVLVVDDVVTTGATLTAAAHALRGGGADAVDAVVVAATPLKAGAQGSDADGGRRRR